MKGPGKKVNTRAGRVDKSQAARLKGGPVTDGALDLAQNGLVYGLFKSSAATAI